MSNTFSYPGCRTDADGPCQLATSSENACSREFGGISVLNQRRYCMCTNGYYNRSSECWNDCYHYSATSTDTLSISLESRIVALDCESYSLGILTDELYYSSLSAASESFASAANSSTQSRVSSSSATTTLGNASQGATASQAVPSATSWIDRPSATGQPQQGAGISTTRAVRNNALLSITVALALSYVFCGS